MPIGRDAARTRFGNYPKRGDLVLERDLLHAMSEETGCEHPLVCAECGAASGPDARGWRGYLTDYGEAVMFCPVCVEREFRDSGLAETDQ